VFFECQHPFSEIRNRDTHNIKTKKLKKMENKDKKIKWTDAQIKEHVKNIQKLIETQKKQNKSENFIALTPEEITLKFQRVNSPLVYYQSWNSTTPGGTVNYNIGMYNPDPTNVIWMFAHVWIGSGNIDPVIGTYLLNVDTRFPRLTEPQFAGLSIAPSANATLSFAIKVPATVERTNYLGNYCLFQFGWFGVGTHYERGGFVFKVS
jgi:hypothetical protein